MQRRLRTLLLVGALVVCLALFVGLFHDFSLTDPAQGWFTGRPQIPLALLLIGFVLMVAQRFVPGGEEE